MGKPEDGSDFKALLRERTKAESTDFVKWKSLPSILVLAAVFILSNPMAVWDALSVLPDAGKAWERLKNVGALDMLLSLGVTCVVYIALRWGQYFLKLLPTATKMYEEQAAEIRELKAIVESHKYETRLQQDRIERVQKVHGAWHNGD
ncbi:MAG: hypothetical protein HY820_24345 [Acidobacteria bacterium]|nr:hypothetical protein [Acidobacteriota bacterium]